MKIDILQVISRKSFAGPNKLFLHHETMILKKKIYFSIVNLLRKKWTPVHWMKSLYTLRALQGQEYLPVALLKAVRLE